MLPDGLLYEGVSNEPILLSGGSAAQSSAIQCFDALLGIQQEGETGKVVSPSTFDPIRSFWIKDLTDSICAVPWLLWQRVFPERLLSSFFHSLFTVFFIDSPYLGAYLTRIRDYMPPAHRQLIETLSVLPSLRDLILSCSSSDLCQAYNSCISALVDLRNYHLNTVTKYIIVPGNSVHATGCPLRGVGTALNTTGTGGSDLMGFLKSVRNTTQNAFILEGPVMSREM